ncbi:MAG: YggS family pyridoxal phosphate-dependent enzyme [Bacteroidales bacterium]|nr:YggS family pyridoxal phosphate-dependent enzyme [Bacteroidales bacterium]
MITENLNIVGATVPSNVTLIAVSKTKPVADLQEAYDAGQRVFGENKALEMRDKHQALPDDIQWHFIGHLQTNKIKYIASFVTLIHSIDSASLLEAVNKEAAKKERIIDCLLQFHIAQEETKFGLDLEEAKQMMESDSFNNMKNIRIVGVMGMATFTDNTNQIRNEFKSLKNIFDFLKDNYFHDKDYFKEISMGMSDDYPIAIEEGATMVRVGSKIFGARNYTINNYCREVSITPIKINNM